jgi:hypothetical protein
MNEDYEIGLGEKLRALCATCGNDQQQWSQDEFHAQCGELLARINGMRRIASAAVQAPTPAAPPRKPQPPQAKAGTPPRTSQPALTDPRRLRERGRPADGLGPSWA